MREENQTIIKALNMFGRVPETWELLNEIERLNNIINELEKTFKRDLESILDFEEKNPGVIMSRFPEYYLEKIKELKEGKE